MKTIRLGLIGCGGMMESHASTVNKVEGIEITDADVTEYFKKYLGGEDSSIAENIYGKSYLKFTALQNKVLDYLIENTPREQ